MTASCWSGRSGGGPEHPAWVHNLRAEPRCTLRFGKVERPGACHGGRRGPGARALVGAGHRGVPLLRDLPAQDRAVDPAVRASSRTIRPADRPPAPRGRRPRHRVRGARRGLALERCGAPARKAGSPSTSATAARMVAGVAATGSRTRATPRAAHRSPFQGWSAPIGKRTIGRPCASAPRTLPEPAWLTTTARHAAGPTACGTKRSTWTCGGLRPRTTRDRSPTRP